MSLMSHDFLLKSSRTRSNHDDDVSEQLFRDSAPASAADQSQDELDIARNLVTYVAPWLLITALLGSLLNIIVLLRITRKLLPSCLYLAIAASVDLTVVALIGANEWLTATFQTQLPQQLMLRNESLCTVYPFVASLLLHLMVWLVVACVTETGIVYLRPQRIYKICTIDRSRAVILLIVVLLIGVNSHCFWSYDLVDVETSDASEPSTRTDQRQQHCIAPLQGANEKFVRFVLPVMNVVVADLVPITLVLSFTVIIITRWNCLSAAIVLNGQHSAATTAAIKATNKRNKQHKFPSKHYRLNVVTSHDFRHMRQLHSATLVIAITYLLAFTPKCVFDIFNYLADEEQLSVLAMTTQLRARLALSRAVCHLLVFLFIATKTVLLLAASQLYRDYAKRLFVCRKSLRRRCCGGYCCYYCCCCCCSRRHRRHNNAKQHKMSSQMTSTSAASAAAAATTIDDVHHQYSSTDVTQVSPLLKGAESHKRLMDNSATTAALAVSQQTPPGPGDSNTTYTDDVIVSGAVGNSRRGSSARNVVAGGGGGGGVSSRARYGENRKFSTRQHNEGVNSVHGDFSVTTVTV